MKYLNLGCGSRFHPAWENVDFVAADSSVRVLDLRERTPYPENAFDVVYHSHVLEHFPRSRALEFLRECHRVLKPGGVLRVAVPDLEGIARLYLESLEKASTGQPGWADKYEWMVMEMYDQCVKEQSRSEVFQFLSRHPMPNQEFIIQRWGTFAIPVLNGVRDNLQSMETASPSSSVAWKYILSHPIEVLQNKLIRLLIGQEKWDAFDAGLFRGAAQAHMLMYDFYSLSRLFRV